MSRSSRLVLASLLCVAAVLLVAACGGDDSSPSPSRTEPTPTFETGETISWGEAVARLNKVRTVEGPVVSLKESGSGDSAVLLVNVGLDAPDPARFVLIVPASVQAKYDHPLADRIDGALIRVTGRIREYEGAASITLDSPKDLKIQH